MDFVGKDFSGCYICFFAISVLWDKGLTILNPRSQFSLESEALYLGSVNTNCSLIKN